MKNMSCYRCGATYSVALHEPLCGKNRQLSIKHKLQVPLCFNCHRLAHDEPTQEFNNQLKKEMQLKFEETHNRSEFVKIFGRNYLD